MRFSAYVTDDLAERAAESYYNAKGAEYGWSEIVQVGLMLIIMSKPSTVRRAYEHISTPRPKYVPVLAGLKKD